ncbi:hypothetical protein [Streptococcus oricebi]|uniref:Uncharacterized protein n=1 Tax=Streptococcus oricebi TaxID=1547447 RepID=A0ABS5B2G5_9STRE|nr:hypothetical protein [Streptococcus oricebi]MBP2622706.1 hypothetical protein [Streptococcus oricebi]
MNKHACKHILFKGEEKYIICPDCGQVIAENMPKDSYLKAQIIKRSRKYKNWLKRKYFIFFLTGGPILLFYLFPFLENYFFIKYGIKGTLSFQSGWDSGYAFMEVSEVLFFLFCILVLPEWDKRKSIPTWHLQKIAPSLCHSWIYWLLKLLLYVCFYYLFHKLLTIYLYEREMEGFRYTLDLDMRKRIAYVYVYLSLQRFNLGLGVLLVHNLWQCFYQRLAIHVNRL